MQRGSRGSQTGQLRVSVSSNIPYKRSLMWRMRECAIYSSELLGHLKRLKTHLPSSPHHSASGNDMQGIISAVGNCAMLTVCLLRHSCHVMAQLLMDQHSIKRRAAPPVSTTLSNMNLTRPRFFNFVHDDLHYWRWSWCLITTS